jgi:hypothetical protein
MVSGCGFLMSVELIDVIFTALGALVAAVVFYGGRISAASSLGRKQGEMETRIQRLEEDIRNIQSNCQGCPERYVSKSSFNEVVHRVDDGIRDLQTRLDTIYSFLVAGRGNNG